MFQVELFEEEYEANHRQVSEDLSFASPHLTWESFDKQNAPEAFVLDPFLPCDLFGIMPIPQHKERLPHKQYQPLRDKSPPLLPLCISIFSLA
jgi:hypothetical protein